MTGGRPDRRGHRQRPSLRGGAPARRGAGRDRSRQDHILLQRQPRIPHAPDADARAARGRCSTIAAGDCLPLSAPARDRAPQQPAPAEARQYAARFLADRGGTRRGELSSRWTCRSYTAELASKFRSAIERAGLGSRSTAPPCRSRSTSTATCGRRSSSICCPTRSSSLSRARSRSRCGTSADRRLRRGRACATRASAFPPQRCRRLFERFHRVEGQRSRSFEGSRHRPRAGAGTGQAARRRHRGARARRARARRSRSRCRSGRRICPPTADRRRAAHGVDRDCAPQAYRRGGAALAARAPHRTIPMLTPDRAGRRTADRRGHAAGARPGRRRQCGHARLRAAAARRALGGRGGRGRPVGARG